ncbi:cytochrome c biogenesis protein CcsA [Oligella ureolytica]
MLVVKFSVSHLIISLFAYSVIALATIQALFDGGIKMTSAHADDFDSKQKFFNRLIKAQPPFASARAFAIQINLDWLCLIDTFCHHWQLGFNALLRSIVTLRPQDIIYPTRWLVFAFLLAGRTLWGWRGRIALRWNLLGFFLLMLAYTGSRFVFEMILGR